jgi:hypothetical protein
MAGLCVANKNNHLGGNDYHERNLAKGDLCLPLHSRWFRRSGAQGSR